MLHREWLHLSGAFVNHDGSRITVQNTGLWRRLWPDIEKAVLTRPHHGPGRHSPFQLVSGVPARQRCPSLRGCPSGTDRDTVADADANGDAQTDTRAVGDVHADSDAATDANSGTDGDARTKPDADADSGADANHGTDGDGDACTNSGANSGADFNAATDANHGTDTRSYAKPDAITGSDGNANGDSDGGAVSNAYTNPGGGARGARRRWGEYGARRACNRGGIGGGWMGLRRHPAAQARGVGFRRGPSLSLTHRGGEVWVAPTAEGG